MQKQIQKYASQIYVGLFLLIWLVLNVAAGIVFVEDIQPIYLFQFSILIFINLGIANELTQYTLMMVLPEKKLARVSNLEKYPKVALLYVTCDDACKESLENMAYQFYPNLDKYILDDSQKDEFKNLINTYPYTIVRRSNRKGFKAGNVNNWLHQFGSKYKYFVIMDSDSILPARFIEKMVMVAEHPDQADGFIFQSKPIIWTKRNVFTRVLTVMNRALMLPVTKLANQCYRALSWGHNDLVRVKPLLENNGYNENYVSEDYATTMDLMQKGYYCYFVNEESYEGMPADLVGFSKRCIRWAKSTLEIFVYYRKHNIPFATKLNLLMTTHSFVIWFLYIPGMILTIWVFQSTILDLKFIIKASLYEWENIAKIIFKFFYLCTFLFMKFPLALKYKVPLKDYFASLLLSVCLSYYMAFPMIIGQLEVLFHRRLKFEVSLKGWQTLSLKYILYQSRYMLIVAAVVLAGIIKINHLGFYYNMIWLLPLLGFPFVLYLFNRK